MIKPNQIPTEAQRETMARAEKALDDYLLKHYKHDSLYVSLPSVKDMTMELWRLLFDKYRQNGWAIAFRESSMDGAPEGPFFSAAE